MRFSLRCIFFLSIIYAAILRDGGFLPDLSAPVARAWPEAQASLERQLVQRVGEVCRGDPAPCLDGAAKLGRLLTPAADAAQRKELSPNVRRERPRGAIGRILP